MTQVVFLFHRLKISLYCIRIETKGILSPIISPSESATTSGGFKSISSIHFILVWITLKISLKVNVNRKKKESTEGIETKLLPVN
jgi:hypothetical protein